MSTTKANMSHVLAFANLTAAGATPSARLEQISKVFTLQTAVTGPATVISATLQGSLDDANWTVLATSTSLTGDQQYAVDKPVLYIRVNLATMTGGTGFVARVAAAI